LYYYQIIIKHLSNHIEHLLNIYRTTIEHPLDINRTVIQTTIEHLSDINRIIAKNIIDRFLITGK